MDKNKKRKAIAVTSLISGYVLSILFILLIVFKLPEREAEARVISPESIIVERNNTVIKTVYVDRVTHNDNIPQFANPVQTHVLVPPTRINNTHESALYSRGFDSRDDNLVVDRDINSRNVKRVAGYRDARRDRDVVNSGDSHDRLDVVDHGLLNRRLREVDATTSIGSSRDTHDIDYGGLSPVSDTDSDLGDIGDIKQINSSKEFDPSGELYAYNYPSRGVGAGIGSSGLGAGTGLSAGIGAGVGEGLSNGDTVPTLGGVGTYSMPGAEANSGPGEGSGVGGLIGGAGAGGAAGLYTGRVTDMLGVGSPGVSGPGNGGSGRANYDHLPKDGALHIMMHVDGSGSILNTRKQLDIMRDTVLKTALLPYYNNDETLYNQRVTIVDGSGERTLRFFASAAEKDNVLAVVFQDEAQPAYHLPNFNKKPEDHYMDDLGKLKTSLNGYGGVYRGVMFQVDRGKTFAKSFKEFVGNAFTGEGYLKSDNLKKYHRDNNTNHIKNRNGIIFSDEYHANDSGDPQYYLDLIFNASKRVGLDLDIYGAGLTDGKYNKKTN